MTRFWLAFSVVALFSATASATQVQEVVSKGGLKAWLVEEHSLPLIAVKIGFRNSGYAYDIKGKEGRATLVAGMLTEGAGKLDARTFNQALEDHAIAFNVTTDEDELDATMQALSEYDEEAFSYLGMALTHPRFDSDSLERARRQTLSLIVQQEQRPGYVLQRRWQNMAFGDHPYGYAQLGTAEGVTQLQKQDMEFFTQHYLTRENIMISVSGDITPAQLSALLDKYFADLPAHYTPDASVVDTTVPDGGAPVVIDFSIPQTMVSFGTRGLKRDDPDYYAAYVMNQILGGGGNLTSRLAREVREKRGLAYSIGSFIDPMTHSASWRGQFATRNDKVGEALAALRDTIRSFVNQGPTDQELADAKQYLIGSFVLHLDNNARMADFLLTMQRDHLGRDYLDKRAAILQAISKRDVMIVAKRLIDPDKLLIAMIGKPNLQVP